MTGEGGATPGCHGMALSLAGNADVALELRPKALVLRPLLQPPVRAQWSELESAELTAGMPWPLLRTAGAVAVSWIGAFLSFDGIIRPDLVTVTVLRVGRAFTDDYVLGTVPRTWTRLDLEAAVSEVHWWTSADEAARGARLVAATESTPFTPLAPDEGN